MTLLICAMGNPDCRKPPLNFENAQFKASFSPTFSLSESIKKLLLQSLELKSPSKLEYASYLELK